NGKPHTRLTTQEALAIEPGLKPKMVNGAVTMDEWGIDPFRLCTANALSAAEAGATIRNHTRVTGFLFEGKRVCGVKVQDFRTGAHEEIRAQVVFNAGGPWVLKILEGTGATAKMRPGKGVHVILDRRVVNVAVMCSAVDGRSIFIMPHDNSTIIGTTDDDFYGDPDSLTVSKDEVEYLIQGIERVLPQVRSARVVRVMAGVRPTLHKWGPNEDELSRDHKVYDHGAQDGVEGLFSMVGGKLAAYRIMSEDATDIIGEALGRKVACTTHVKPLPGGEKQLDLPKLAEESGLSEYALARIHFRHGARTQDIANLCKERPGLQRIVCACEPVTAAELTYAVRSEWAAKLSDLRRRTRLGTGPCQGCRCTLEAGCVLAEELGHSGEGQLQETYDFLRNRWKGKVPILEGEQVAQEELLQQTHLRVLGMHHFVGDDGPFEGWRDLAKAAREPAPVRPRKEVASE
ncbi:MAG: FAD-dependent oxidoreductase, partial [Chrysiogenetes bacterium]|nr:FAD-dependent oxidoreductase [Chrysiogenetes bacterium]